MYRPLMTDARVLTAMAHPLRRRLLDVLRVHGPGTASVLAERTAQAVGNVSHHMRILAEAGLVEEAPELARDRREREGVIALLSATKAVVSGPHVSSQERRRIKRREMPSACFARPTRRGACPAPSHRSRSDDR